jgi:hypothetical protein
MKTKITYEFDSEVDGSRAFRPHLYLNDVASDVSEMRELIRGFLKHGPDTDAETFPTEAEALLEKVYSRLCQLDSLLSGD